jgi:hypothetical protein
MATRKKSPGKKSAGKSGGKRTTAAKRGGKGLRGPMKSDIVRPPQK